MTHELRTILETAFKYHQNGLSCVLATVTHLEGSSYRKPGVRMLICEDNTMTGAVSGGCVEKEVLFQAASVFRNKQPKMMTYDGRYRLGCEGILHILIEPFQIDEYFLNTLNLEFERRTKIQIAVLYSLSSEIFPLEMGTVIFLENGIQLKPFIPRETYKKEIAENLHVFKQELPPLFQLFYLVQNMMPYS